ncbi:MAG: MGMT family protein [Myxococcota bacterium]|jgi:methylated-DNA-protein-cysteine methyltransferase-like protein|nr:MGMT family protein [Myxococcota bacterium]
MPGKARDAKAPAASNYRRIYAVVRRIPRGKVATYGQVAELAELRGHARQVGYALHATPDDVEIPWQRVINAKGEVSTRVDPMMEGLQRSLLEAEGVVFDRHGRVDLDRFRWRAGLDSEPRRKKAARRKTRKETRP